MNEILNFNYKFRDINSELLKIKNMKILKFKQITFNMLKTYNKL